MNSWCSWVSTTYAHQGLTLRHQVILPATPEAALLARAALNDVLPPRALGSRRDEARLVMSELVTNAVKHGTQQGEDVVRVTIEVAEGALRVEVEQPTPTPPLHPSREVEDALGFGLHIVDALADDWGTEAGPPGRVWFEFGGESERKSPDHPWG